MDEGAGRLLARSDASPRVATGTGEGGSVGPDAVERAQQGDLPAFEAIYRAYRCRIAAYLDRLVRDPDLAADLTQDVFVRAFRAIRETRPGLNLKPWLFNIATNAALSYHRHRRLIQWLPLDLVPEPPTPVGLEQRVVDRDRLGIALAALPRDQVACFLLWAREGLSYEEIGKAVGVSPGAAKTRTYRARVALAGALRAQEEER
jgi:RNA polymerase sigma-70 factor (ECF subfamily)